MNTSNETVAGIISAMRGVLERQPPHDCNQINLPSDRAVALLDYIAQLELQNETRPQQALKEIAEICNTDYGPAAMARVTEIVRRTQDAGSLPQKATAPETLAVDPACPGCGWTSGAHAIECPDDPAQRP